MKLYSAMWCENGRAGQKSFRYFEQAKEFATSKIESADCGPVAVWEFSTTGGALEALVDAHDKTAWWGQKKYRGCALKNGSWTSR